MVFDRAYLPKLVSLLRQAKRTITARIFLIDPGIPKPSPLEGIFEALGEARKRDVRVDVETAGLFRRKPSGKRLRAFAGRFGIPIRWRAGEFLHEKSVAIDDGIHLIGSHNWSPASLLSNREATLVLDLRARRDGGEAPSFLNGSEFRRELLAKIREAKKEITLATYDMDDIAETDQDFADEVARQLVFARMKKKKVRLLLDASLAARPGTDGGDILLYRGRKKAEEVSRGKVPVYYDTTQALFHAKIAVMDGEWAFVGSQNINPVREGEVEKTVLIRSAEAAAALKTYLAGVLRLAERFRYDPLETPGVRIPAAWVRRGGAIAKLFQKRGKRTLDLLLALLHEAQRLGSFEIPWDGERLAELSGIRTEILPSAKRSGGPQEGGAAERRRTLRRILNQPRIFLRREYRLLRYQSRRWVSLEKVTLLDGKGRPFQTPQKDFFVIPWEYWTGGWHRRLNTGERYAYLIHLAEVSQSPEAPIWSMRVRDVPKAYGISWQRFAKQTIRLERLNLIDVARDPKIVLRNVFKRPNRYRVNGLWSEAEERLGLERLKKEFMAGDGPFEAAQRFADRLNQPHDLDVIRKFLVLVEQHGEDRVRKAVSLTSRFKPHFALRNVHHTGGILRNWEKGIRL